MSHFEIEGFRIDQTPIGGGCCGEVFRALDLESKKGYAAKRYRSMAVDRNLMVKLFDQYAGMPPHPGIIPLKTHQFDQTPYYTVVEFENGKPLYDCGFFEEADCWQLIRTMGEALGHAHKYGLKHGNLHPGNVFLLEHQDGSWQLRIGDFATGMMGQVHHVDLGETAYFAAPEQLFSLGSDFEGGKAERWDVYRFGAVAFWLLNRMLPRARGYRKARAQDIANSGGRPVPIDPFRLAESALEEGKLSWGKGVAKGKREKRYREIIESCLSLDAQDRPVDMREVDDAFTAVDDEFFFNETVEKANAALHDAENRVTRERLKQKAKLFTARATATILAASFMIATFYLLTYLKKTWESSNRIIELDQVVANQRAHISILGDKVEATVDDLRQSREAADASFYGMTQSVEGGQAEASLIKQLAQLRTYYLEILKEAADREEAAAERGRALHSLALIEKRMSRDEEAVDHFGKSIATFEVLLKDSDTSSEKNRQDMMMRLADSYENVAILNDKPGDGDVIAALSRAVWYLKQVLLIAPDDPMVANRLADCSFRLGQILEDQNQFEAAIGSYSEAAGQVVQLRQDTEEPDKIRHYDEMIAKLQFHAATSLQRVGRIEEATESFIAAIESVENLREIEGYSLE